jgi:hypothetical protein
MRYIFLLLTLCSVVSLHAQNYIWKLGLDYFFDNRENDKYAKIVLKQAKSLFDELTRRKPLQLSLF